MMLDATGSLLISVGTSYFAPSALSKIHGTPYLGRCPRLLHFAPLALGLGVFTRSLTRVVLTSCSGDIRQTLQFVERVYRIPASNPPGRMKATAALMPTARSTTPNPKQA